MNEDELGNGQEKKITMPIISKKKKKRQLKQNKGDVIFYHLIYSKCISMFL